MDVAGYSQEIILLNLLLNVLSDCSLNQRHYQTVLSLLNQELKRAGDSKHSMINHLYFNDLEKIKNTDFKHYDQLASQNKRFKSKQSLEYRRIMTLLKLTIENHIVQIEINKH